MQPTRVLRRYSVPWRKRCLIKVSTLPSTETWQETWSLIFFVWRTRQIKACSSSLNLNLFCDLIAEMNCRSWKVFLWKRKLETESLKNYCRRLNFTFRTLGSIGMYIIRLSSANDDAKTLETSPNILDGHMIFIPHQILNPSFGF